MSSFMCSNETLMSIALYLYKNHSKWLAREYERDYLKTIDIYKELHALNVKALEERYSREQVEKMYFEPVDHISDIDRTKVTEDIGFPLYARLRCFLYQCEEGCVPNEPLFIFLSKEVEPEMARNLLEDIMNVTDFRWQDYAY